MQLVACFPQLIWHLIKYSDTSKESTLFLNQNRLQIHFQLLSWSSMACMNGSPIVLQNRGNIVFRLGSNMFYCDKITKPYGFYSNCKHNFFKNTVTIKGMKIIFDNPWLVCRFSDIWLRWIRLTFHWFICKQWIIILLQLWLIKNKLLKKRSHISHIRQDSVF